MITNDVMKQKDEPILLKVWRNNKISNTVLMALPYELVKKHDIKPHNNLLAIDTEEGILLRKIDLRELKNV